MCFHSGFPDDSNDLEFHLKGFPSSGKRSKGQVILGASHPPAPTLSTPQFCQIWLYGLDFAYLQGGRPFFVGKMLFFVRLCVQRGPGTTQLASCSWVGIGTEWTAFTLFLNCQHNSFVLNWFLFAFRVLP